jgi:hypothetical protein
MLRVGDGIPNHILQKDLEDTTGLFVDQTGDTLDTPTASETTDRGLGNTLDVIAKDLAMTLGTSLSQSLSSFSSARHDEIIVIFLLYGIEQQEIVRSTQVFSASIFDKPDSGAVCLGPRARI